MANDDNQGTRRLPLPDKKKKQMFAVADSMQGGSRLRVICEDGEARMARIKGKHKRRMWIREGDLLIIEPWDFQDEKADVVYRYIKTESQQLSREGKLPDTLDIF